MNYPREKADELFLAKKYLSPPPSGWGCRENSSGKETGKSLDCLIEIQGAIWRGAELRIILSAGSLDKCSFSLLVKAGDTRARFPLYRLDINPTRPHINRFVGPKELQGLRFPPGKTHEHVYSDNLDENGCLTDRCDTIARHISNPPTTFDEALEYIRVRLNIEDVGKIPRPETQGDLF